MQNIYSGVLSYIFVHFYTLYSDFPCAAFVPQVVFIFTIILYCDYEKSRLWFSIMTIIVFWRDDILLQYYDLCALVY